MPSKKSQKGSANTLKQPTMTFQCINHWYDCVFKKLGWNVIDYENHTNYEEYKGIEAYINEIRELKSAIELHIKFTNDKDKRNDLKIMSKNTDTLLKHAEKDFEKKFHQ